MENYFTSIQLLGLGDQNLPVFKDTRYKRLASIEKMNKLVTILPRLVPKLPNKVFILDSKDPEWDDKMIYPKVHYYRYIYESFYWMVFTGFYCYNWNVIQANKRLRHLKNLYPVLSLMFLTKIYTGYSWELYKVALFDDYCEVRAKELFNENKYMLNHEHFKRFVYFHEDFKETLGRVHRQANNHSADDFKDSELILQDFIRRYSDPENPDSAIFYSDGKIKFFN